jgi:hypothetical protein
MSTAIGVSLPRLATAVGKAVSEYAVLGKTPGFTADFIKNKYPGYASFSNAITHARAGNATMTDGYGPELIDNPSFSDTSFWTTTATSPATSTIANGVVTIVSPAGEGATCQADILTIGKVYEVTVKVKVRSGNCKVQLGSGATANGTKYFSSSGTYTFVRENDGSDGILFLARSGACDADFDDISVREIPVIKWAPHNLLTYSEDFSQWTATFSTITTNAIAAPDGTQTADLLSYASAGGSRVTKSITIDSASSITFSTFLKESSGDGARLLIYNLTTASTVTSLNISDFTTGISAGNGWYQHSLTATSGFSSGDSLLFYIYSDTASGSVAGSSVYIWGAHVYRSDLGGMVDNPDQPPSRSSYVPTTSAAKYLPRIGHHVFNSSAWVNEGVLAESESRTNSILYSNDLSQTGWSKQQTTVTGSAGISPDGTNNAWKLSETAVTGTHLLVVTVTASECCSIYAKAGTRSRFRINSGTSGNAFAEFNLADGTITSSGGTYYLDSTMEDVGNGWYRCSVSFSGSPTTSFTVAMENDSGLVSYAGDTSKHIFLYGGQSEAGKATPSSYIPTDSATVSRAAETFTIPSANLPWPTPQYIGSELVTNGTFDTDTTGWSTAGGTVSLSSVSGELEIDGDANTFALQNISLTAGKVYRLTGTARLGTHDGSVRVYIGTSFSVVTSTENTDVDIIYVATSSSANINLRLHDGVTGGTAYFDNISVREINPLSVSIGMEGRMTYADTDTNSEVQFYYWYDGTSLIFEKLRTDGSRQGQLYTSSSPNGGNVSSGNNVYTPDILVPFSLSARFGSTFVNAAHDGTVLTASTAPTALPDLSSTDLELAYEYMGTISEFRVWDRDITDDGLVEATNPSLEPSLSLEFSGLTNSFVINDWSE